MADLNSYGYKGEPKGFWSKTAQINWHMDRFRDANEAALDRNTEAIIAQTEQQRIDAEALRAVITAQTEQQRLDADAGRNIFKDWMSNLIGSVKKIFSKDTTDEDTSFYEMMENEQKRMQGFVSAHTNTVKDGTNTTNARLESIIQELSEIEKSIDANTSGDVTNANNIKNAISNLKLSVTNHIEVPRN